MKKLLFTLFSMSAITVSAQNISVAWDELTGPDFRRAVELSEGVCVLPMGVMEKHGAHLPLGTDLYSARYVSRRAAEQEYAVVFPAYFFGQINEAKQQPGTVAYSPELLYKVLDETCREIARNGMKKIILCNSHGGNPMFLQYFCQTQLASERDYVVYLFDPSIDRATQQKINEMRESTTGGHGDEVETSTLIVARPDLVKMSAVNDESGRDLARLNLENAYTAIWWYASYPNHYAGDASGADKELGEVRLKQWSDQLADVIRQVKADDTTAKLQQQFFREAADPMSTPIFD